MAVESCGLRSGIVAVVFLGVALLHLKYAKVGWFYRYEAYLVCLGVVAFVLLLQEIFLRQGFSWQSLAPRFGPAWAKCAALAIPLAFLSEPLVERGIQSYKDTAIAPLNNYQQQYQMGLFLHEYYEGAGVAANDIGAINFLANIRCLDLMGLTDVEVARLWRTFKCDTAQIRRIAREKKVEIAIVYDSFFVQSYALPPEWIKVGQWTISNNVICSGNTVTFYAVDRAKAVHCAATSRNFSNGFQPAWPPTWPRYRPWKPYAHHPRKVPHEKSHCYHHHQSTHEGDRIVPGHEGLGTGRDRRLEDAGRLSPGSGHLRAAAPSRRNTTRPSPKRSAGTAFSGAASGCSGPKT